MIEAIPTMSTTRRDLFRFAALGAAAAGATSFQPLRALCGRHIPNANDEKLFVIFLRGGMDGIYTVAPTAALDPSYATVRAGLLTPVGASPLVLDGVAHLNEAYALLDRPGGPLAAGKLRIAMQVGNPLGERSHFDEMAKLEDAKLGSTANSKADGVFTRLAASHLPGAPLRTASIGANLQRWFRGDAYPSAHVKSVGDYAIEHEDQSYLGTAIGPAMRNALPGQTFAQVVRDGKTAHFGQTFAGTTGAAQLATVATGGFLLDTEAGIKQVTPTGDPSLFPLNAAAVAALTPATPLPDNPAGYVLMKQCDDAFAILTQTDCSVVGVEFGGWDTHVDQATSRAQIDMWLAKAIDSLYRLAALESKPVTILVMTEFGRTQAVNTSGGTDHGHGGIVITCGNTTVNGTHAGSPKVLANMDSATWTSMATTISNPALPLWKDSLPVRTWFGAVYRELFRKRFGITGAALDLLAAPLGSQPSVPTGLDRELGLFL